jgi:hypothetical protein
MGAYLHCADCVNQCPKGRSLKQFARLEVSIEEDGLLVRCLRHDKIVVLLDPVMLLNWMSNPPKCEMCEQGVPHKH